MEPNCSPHAGFFRLESILRQGAYTGPAKEERDPASKQVFLCEHDEETIDHLLIHCSRAKMLWDLLLSIVDSYWVFPLTIRQSLLAWQHAKVGRKRKRVWMAIPLCLFWTLWKERNKAAFENKTPSVHRLKSTFVCTLWSWAKLNSIDNLDSLVDFFTLLGYR